MATGAGLRARVKTLELPPDPKVRAPDFYPDRLRVHLLGEPRAEVQNGAFHGSARRTRFTAQRGHVLDESTCVY